MDFLEENYVIMEALLLTWRLEPCQKVQHQTSVGSGKNCPEFPLTFVCSSTVCRLQLLSFQTLKVSNWSSECEWWQLVIWMNGCCVVRRFIPKSSWIWLYLNLNPQISCLLTIWYNRKYTQFILIWNCFRKTVHQEGQYMEPLSLLSPSASWSWSHYYQNDHLYQHFYKSFIPSHLQQETPSRHFSISPTFRDNRLHRPVAQPVGGEDQPSSGVPLGTQHSRPTLIHFWSQHQHSWCNWEETIHSDTN